MVDRSSIFGFIFLVCIGLFFSIYYFEMSFFTSLLSSSTPAALPPSAIGGGGKISNLKNDVGGHVISWQKGGFSNYTINIKTSGSPYTLKPSGIGMITVSDSNYISNFRLQSDTMVCD